MAERTNYDEVIAILEDCDLEESKINPSIEAANTLVNSIFGTGNSQMLTQIEKYLAAHFVASTNHRQTSQEGLGDGKQTFTGKWGDRLMSTSYGQIALTLDTTGKLAKAGKQVIRIIAVKTVYK